MVIMLEAIPKDGHRDRRYRRTRTYAGIHTHLRNTDLEACTRHLPVLSREWRGAHVKQVSSCWVDVYFSMSQG